MSDLMAERESLQNRNSLLEKVVQVRSASDRAVQPQVRLLLQGHRIVCKICHKRKRPSSWDLLMCKSSICLIALWSAHDVLTECQSYGLEA